MISSDPRLRADLRRMAFVVSAMINMLIAIAGAQRVARSAVGECIVMFGMQYFEFSVATILALGNALGVAGAAGRLASGRRAQRSARSSRQSRHLHRCRKFPKFGDVIDALC